VDVAADTYAYPAGFNTFSAIIPPWAHDGGDKKLIERLKDPAMRARIRKEMETPSGDWNNEWQEVTGPESILVGAVQNPKLLPLQGKSIAEIAKLWHKDPIDTIFDLLIEDEAFTRWPCSSCRSPTSRWRSSSRGSRSATIRRAPRPMVCWARSTRIRAPTGRSRASCAKYVREEKKLTLEDAIRKFSALPAAAHALRRSRRAEGRHVGRRGGLRSGHHSRRGDLRESESAIGGHALRAGERRAGDRRREDDQRPAGASGDAC
jgi:N-acyl-D-amino-acid deacylase